MDLYQEKYLKYKSKYELLKKQYGGNKRILSDLKGLMKLPYVKYTYGLTAVPIATDIKFSQNGKYTWKVYLIGPAGTPYEGYKWIVKIDFPNDYPFKQADIKFETRIFHPNISFEIDELVNRRPIRIESLDWNPSIAIARIFVEIIEILKHPNIHEEPLNPVALSLYNSGIGYLERVKNYAEQFAERV